MPALKMFHLLALPGNGVEGCHQPSKLDRRRRCSSGSIIRERRKDQDCSRGLASESRASRSRSFRSWPLDAVKPTAVLRSCSSPELSIGRDLDFTNSSITSDFAVGLQSCSFAELTFGVNVVIGIRSDVVAA